MSIRPTTVVRQELASLTSASSPFGFAIIGDTVAATLYAKRLLNNGVTTPISIITDGVDRTNIQDLTAIDFAADNNRRILHYLETEQIHMVPSGDNQDEADDTIVNPQAERIIHYHVGAGPLGDFIAAYHIPRLGPWFTHPSNGHLERFLTNHTVKSALTTQETTVVNRLQQIWGIPATSSLVVKHPSILNVHYEFIQQQDDTFQRDLFLDDYHLVNQAGNVDYLTEVSDIKFTQVTGTSAPILYDITGNNVSLQSVRHVFKTNPFTHLRIATDSGLHPAPFLLPTFYRAVLSLPLSGTGATGSIDINDSTIGPGPNGFVCVASGSTPLSPAGTVCFAGLTGLTGVNLRGVTGTEDLVTSHITFSLHDIANPRQSGLAWLIQAYTTTEDLSVVQQEGRFASSGRTLLIVEAISTKNRRRTTFNTAENEVQVNYNDRVMENGYFRQFANIVASIFNAYTGVLISADDLINDVSACASISGICQDRNALVDYSLRESPMVSILQLASDLYGSEIFPTR